MILKSTGTVRGIEEEKFPPRCVPSNKMFAARNSSPVHQGFSTEEVAAYQVGDDVDVVCASSDN